MRTYFVSSTFKDMQFERDALHTIVAPIINEKGAAYGESIDFCDLRWGIDTSGMSSDESAAKVLDVCLGEIDRCRPRMIVLMGERYGWIPKKKRLKSAVKAFSAEFYAQIEAELKMSVTQLEIEYGVLSGDDKNDAFFFFRELDGNVPKEYKAESIRHKRFLRELKNRIKTITGCNVHTYKAHWNEDTQQLEGMDYFSNLVCETIYPSLEKEWEELKLLDSKERERKIHNDFAVSKASFFCGRTKLVSRITNALFLHKRLALCGNSGVGKSTLMAYISEYFKKKGLHTFPVFCGLTPNSDSINEIIYGMIRHLEDCIGLLPRKFSKKSSTYNQELVEYLNELIGLYSNTDLSATVFAIDALDQLGNINDYDLANFLTVHYTDKVFLLFSHLPSLVCEGVPHLTIDVLSKDEEREILEGMLKFSNREVGRAVIEKILEKPSANLPLYGNLLIQRLSLIDRTDFDKIYKTDGTGNGIMRYQKALIDKCPDNVENLCTELIREASKKIGGDFVEEALRYLAVSRFGLRQSDLNHLLSADKVHFINLDFAYFLRFLNNFFITRSDGCIDFAHQSIRQGILKEIDRRRYDSAIFHYLNALPEEDSVRKACIIYHCLKAGEKKPFIELFEKEWKETRDYSGTSALIKTLNADDEVKTNLLFLFYRFEYSFLYDISQKSEDFLKEAEALTKEYHADGRIDDISYHLINTALNHALYNCTRVKEGADAPNTKLYLDSAVSESKYLSESTVYRDNKDCQLLLGAVENAKGVILMESEIKNLTDDPMVYFGKSFSYFARLNHREGIKNEMVNAMLWRKKQAGFYRRNNIDKNSGGWNVPLDSFNDEIYSSLLNQAIEWLYKAYYYFINGDTFTCSFEELENLIKKEAKFRTLPEMNFPDETATRRQYYEYCYQIYFENTNHPGKDSSFWSNSADMAYESVAKAIEKAKEDGEGTEVLRLNRYKGSVVKRFGELSADSETRSKYLLDAIRILDKNDLSEGHRSKLLRLRELAYAYISAKDYASAIKTMETIDNMLFETEQNIDWVGELRKKVKTLSAN